MVHIILSNTIPNVKRYFFKLPFLYSRIEDRIVNVNSILIIQTVVVES